MVDFIFGVNDSKVQSAFRNVSAGAKNLSHEVNSGVKEALAEAFSAAYIAEMVVKMTEFADATVKGAEKLDTTTDSFQALRIAAREAHADISLFEKSFANIEKAASSALGGDSKLHKAFQNLGITDADIKNLKNVELLQKIMQGTQGMSRNEGVANLNALGIRSLNANSLLAIQPQLADFKNFKQDLKENGQIASNADLNNLAELKDRWEDIADTFRTKLIPGLVLVMDAINYLSKGLVQLAQLVGTTVGAMLGNLQNVSVKSVAQGAVEFTKGEIATTFDALKNGTEAFLGKKSFGDAIDDTAKTMADHDAKTVTTVFGEQGAANIGSIINDQLLEFAEQDKQDAAREEQRRKAREEADKAKEGQANRVPSIKGDGKSMLDLDLKGGDSSLVKIGALGGIDTFYRLARLSQEANNYLKTIAANTDPANNNGNSGGDMDGQFTD